jgi:hypothetical protein
MGERKERGCTAGSAGRGGSRVARFFGWSWLRGSVRGRSWFSRGRGAIGRCAVSVQFLDAHNILIGNLPAKLFLLSTLFEMFFEEDGTAGIGGKRASRGQKDIAGAVLHLDPTPEKGRVAGHTGPSVGRSGRCVNSTEGLVRWIVWKSGRRRKRCRLQPPVAPWAGGQRHKNQRARTGFGGAHLPLCGTPECDYPEPKTSRPPKMSRDKGRCKPLEYPTFSRFAEEEVRG